MFVTTMNVGNNSKSDVPENNSSNEEKDMTPNQITEE